MTGGTLREMLSVLNLDYQVPYRTSMTKPGSVDIIVSCSVLEHIKPQYLRRMLEEFKGLLSSDGAMIHFIDNSDHYEQMDKSISRVNFLKFDDWTWNLLTLNPQSVQNRLRHSEYRSLFQGMGFGIAHEWREVRARELAELASLPLARRFRGRAPDDLAAISSGFVLVKNPPRPASAGIAA